MIDFSCADEVVAKLLMRYVADDAPQEAYFIFRGVTEDHRDAIETVLERHGLALALELADGVERAWACSRDAERRVWDASYRLGRAPRRRRRAPDRRRLRRRRAATLDALCRRRLMMRVDDEYVAVGDVARG